MNIISALCVLCIGFLAACFGLWTVYSFLRSRLGKYPPSISSFGNMNKVMIELAGEILSGAEKPMKVVDMGSGTGKILRTLSVKYPQHNYTGYEWDLFVYKISRVMCRRHKNIVIHKKDFMTADISSEDLIITFCGNEIADELSRKILKEAKSGVRVISEAFRLPALPDEKVYKAKTWGFMPIKVYTYYLHK